LPSAMPSGSPPALSARAKCRVNAPTMGLFDMFKETPEQKAAKDAAWREQQEMLARRRDPKAMEEYMKEVEASRTAAAASDVELKQLQKGDGTGADKLEAWKAMKAEGKVKSMDDTERDTKSSRLGSEGLIAERIDEKLPYIDDGYVDESQPDLMKGLSKLFGGNKD